MLALAGCGGGNSGDSTTAAPTSGNASLGATVATDSNAPPVTGNTATDGFNWFNFRRQQAGVPVVARNSMLDTAAQGHSDYQKQNNTITHEQTVGQPGFTGQTTGDRLAAAGYKFTSPSGFAYGEVISATSSASGVKAAEDLITAIYHRFVILEPMFKEAGAGSAISGSGTTYFTTDFAANGLTTGLGNGRVVTYPFDGQQGVRHTFFSDNESPDPVPGRNEVGYPISVHADITATVSVQSFTVQPRGGAPLATQLMSSTTDPNTPSSAAAIVPLDPLVAATTYDVQFNGTVNGIKVARNWSFTTQ